MNDLKPLTIKDAPEASQPLLTQMKSQLGFVPNLMEILAHSPAGLKAYKAIEAASQDSSLTPKERNIVLLTASVQNGCAYCVASHSTTLKHLYRGDDSIAKAIRNQERLSDEKLDALVQFTREMVQERGFASEQSKEAFLKAGYTAVNMIDVVVGIAQKTISNYVDHLFPASIEAAFTKDI